MAALSEDVLKKLISPNAKALSKPGGVERAMEDRDPGEYDDFDDSMSHGNIETERQPDGTRICRFDAENSIELILRIIQCGDAVEILEPASFRTKFKDYLQNILRLYN